MEKIITETTDILFEAIKDALYIIDQNRLDRMNTALLFDKLNKIIIASTLLARLASKSDISIDPEGRLIEIKLSVLSVLKLISKSVKASNFSLTHDLISLELRDSLVKWIIQIIPSLRQGLAECQSGRILNSEQNFSSLN